MADQNDPLAQFKRAPTKEDPLAEYARPVSLEDSTQAANQIVLGEPPPEPESLGRQIGRTFTGAIPLTTGLIGAALATPETLGTGTLLGGGLGYAAGKPLEDVANQYFFGDKPRSATVAETFQHAPLDVATGVAYEMGGQLGGKALEAAAPIVSQGVKQGIEGVSPYIAPAAGYAKGVASNARSAIAQGASKGLLKVGEAVSNFPGVKTLAEIAEPGSVESVKRSVQLGEQGILPTVPEHMAKVASKGTQATENLATPIGNIQQVGKAELEGVVAQEAKREAAEKAAVQHAKDYNATQEANHRAMQKSMEAEAKVAQKTERTKLEEEIRAKVEAKRPAEEASRLKAAEEGQQGVISEAGRLAKSVQKEKDNAGKAVEAAYKSLDDAGFKFDAANTVANVQNDLNQLGANNPQLSARMAKLNDNISSFNRPLDGQGMKNLKKTISNAVDELSDVPYAQRQLIEAYGNLNKDIVSQAGHLPEATKLLTKANSDYTAASILQQEVGRPATRAGVEIIPDKAINFVESLSKGVEGSSAVAQSNKENFSLLKSINPEVAAQIEANLNRVAQTRAATKANVSDSEINNWLKRQVDAELKKLPPLQEPVVSLPAPSQMATPVVIPANAEAAIAQNPALAPTLPSAKRLSETVGEQAPLTSLAPEAPMEYSVGEGLKNLIKKSAKGPLTDPNLVQSQKAIHEIIPRGEELLGTAVEAQKMIDTAQRIAKAKIDLKRPFEATTDAVTRAANLLAFKASGGSLTGALNKASGEALADAGTALLQSPEVSHQFFGNVLKKAAGQTGTSKAITLFILQQNPEFRSMFNKEEKQGQ